MVPRKDELELSSKVFIHSSTSVPSELESSIYKTVTDDIVVLFPQTLPEPWSESAVAISQVNNCPSEVPFGPDGPVDPDGPVEPLGPVGPVGPAPPVGPVGPVGPEGIVNAKTLAVSGPEADTPTGPVLAVGVSNPAAVPVGPAGPEEPVGPLGPVGPVGPVAPVGP